MKKTLIALILAMSAFLSVGVSAEDAAVPEADAPESVVVPAELEGCTLLRVTSSDSSIPGTNEKIETSLLFDRLAATGCTLNFLDPEKAEAFDMYISVASEKAVSVYTSTGVPNALKALSLIMDAESGTLVSVSVYGTNDNLLLDWTQLSFENLYSEDGENNVFRIAGEYEKFVFYRIDLTLVEGDAFTVSEIGLYKDAADTDEYRYVFSESIEPGETPELVAVPSEEAPAADESAEEADDGLRKVPMFGIGSLPGMFRPVPHK